MVNRFKGDGLALAAITLVVIVFFSPVIFGGKWLPGGGGGDLAVFLWPIYSFASRTLRSGQLPLWNPHLYSGAPYWADNQSSVLYPPTLLVLLLTDVPYQALESLSIFHVWLAGVLMYLCIRNLGDFGAGGAAAGRMPSLLGAILWMLSDGFVTHIGNLNLIAAAAWLPLVFLGTWRALRDLKWRWALPASVAFGLAILAGHAQVAYFTALVIVAVGLWQVAARALTAASARHSFPLLPILKVGGLTALVAGIGLGISAGAWLPALEMTAQTGRIGLAYADAAKFSLPPRALVGLVAPWVYGRGPDYFTGAWDRVEVGYIGVVGLALSLAGAWLAIRRRSGLGIFLALAALLAFGIALGKFSPLHHLAYDLIPGFKNFRAPARIVLLMNFAQALLASYAIMVWQEMGRMQPSRFRAVFPWVLVVAMTGELIGFGINAEVDSADPRANFNHPEAIAWLEAQPDRPFRIDTAAAGRWQSDLAALHGDPLYDIYGVANPLALASYESAYWSVGSRGSPTYNFLGARYVLSDGPPPGDAAFKLAAQFPDGLAIYQNTRAVPMALLVYRAVPVESAERASNLTHLPDWDAWRVVYVEGGPPLDGDSPSGASLSYTEYGPNRIALKVTTPKPAYLVLSEVYYPGWEAAIDGRAAPIYRANQAFRAIYINQEGEHTITLDFRPRLVYWGLAISAATTIGTLGFLGLRWAIHRKDAKSAKGARERRASAMDRDVGP